jgi:hypothetical protein
MTARQTTSLMVLAVALAWIAPATAADLSPPALQPPQPLPASTAPSASAGGFAPPDAACLEWTDGCRTCQRPPAGEIACSNVGIACVPQAMRCTRR